MSEDAAWTKPLDVGYEACLPKIGLKVLDHIRLLRPTPPISRPIFNKIEGSKPDVIITGISHVGVQPTVQWKNQQVPIPMLGISSQATNENLRQGQPTTLPTGVLYQRAFSGPGVAVTPKSISVRRGRSRRSSATILPMPAIPPMTRVYYIADAVKARRFDRCGQTGWMRWEKDRLGRYHRPHSILRQGTTSSPMA